MPDASRFRTPSFALSLPLAIVLGAAIPSPGAAAVTVSSIAPGSENPFLTGLEIEDFEDVNLIAGFTVVFSVWRNGSNVITANSPVSYTGVLPSTWTPGLLGLGNNAWDGTRALVNGWSHVWANPWATSVEFQFSPARPTVGIGLGNFQRDSDSDFTYHTLFVNGVDMGKLEDLPGWVSGVNVKNRYLVVSGEPITSIRFTADTNYDGLVFDKLATNSLSTPTKGMSWGRLKSLFR